MPLLREPEPISSESPRTLRSPGSKILIPLVLLASVCSGATIFDSGLATLKATDPIQRGRLSRNGVFSDWSAPEPFPGVVNPTASFRYATFVLPYVEYPYIQIMFDDVSGTAQTFASAYLNSYVPNNTAPNFGLNINYLGDEGFSGNAFGSVPNAFQVVMPLGGTLVLVVNDASTTGAGIGQPFRLLVEGFISTDFNDVPEPATFGLLAAALGAGALLARKKKQVH
ncbi:MAG: PEP-CTERM sorting domain-containing protein [Bryobacteraceae bacterium]